MGRKASFLANSTAIGKKSNESGEPEPALPQTAGSYAEGPKATQIHRKRAIAIDSGVGAPDQLFF